MNMNEFIDLCILCGCDYTHSIKGVGPVRAFNFITHNRSIEGVLEQIDVLNDDASKKRKFTLPDKFLYEESRVLFKQPQVNSDIESIKQILKWEKPNEQNLVNYLI